MDNNTVPLYRVGFDIGGTFLRSVVLNPEGVVLDRRCTRLHSTSVEDVLHAVGHTTRSLDVPLQETALGVGVAAWVDVDTGMVWNAPNLGWVEVPFKQLLEQTCGRAVKLMNDLDARVWGEWTCGAATDAGGHVVCVALGTGCGMGVVSHGVLLEGASGIATEIGHLKIASTRSGRMCGCGQRGCLEAYTSGKHLPACYAQLHPEGNVPHDAAEIERLACEADPSALALWENTAAFMGRAVASVVTLFNPRVLLLEGGVFNAAPSLKQRTLECVAREAVPHAYKRLQVRSSVLGDYAGALGAAWASVMA